MNEPAGSISKHRLELARDLLDDIELSRLGPEQLLLKAARLARTCDDAEVRTWLAFELVGYENTEEGRKYMSLMGRWTDEAKGLGYWESFAGINGSIAAMQIQIQQLRVPNVRLSVSSANPHEFVTGFGGLNLAGVSTPSTDVLNRLQELTSSISDLSSIRSRVVAHVHAFVSRAYYALAFSGAAESIFQRHQVAIDNMLRETAPDVLEKIPSVSERLAAGDAEAVSQAMNSCRRMIKAFADAVYPSSDVPVTADGQEYQVGSEKVLNRIHMYLRDGCPSESRRERLNQTIRRIHERASAASHADVSTDEARSLFLSTYLVLGEILGASKATTDNKSPAPAGSSGTAS
jgi:hypothetical protein